MPSVLVNAPGRVNLIGDHTDYNDGFVLPAAINVATTVAASPRADRKVNVVAVDCDNDSSLFSLDDIKPSTQRDWVNYIRGSLSELLTRYPEIKGANLVVSGDIPQGAGLSSSASLEIAILKTFSRLYHLDLDGISAAKLGQSAENNFVGCNCGIMDQLASACGKAGSAMLLDCRSLTQQFAAIPDGISIVIVNSNVKRGLVDSAYNERREQCEAVARFMEVPALRDVELSQLLKVEPSINKTLFRRARHVITENERTIKALEALSKQDMASLSQLMSESHWSLRDDFEVTVSEVDYLVDIISDVIQDKGGVRMTGGGFGGCVVALVPDELVSQVRIAVQEKYKKETGIEASIYLCTSESGAFAEAVLASTSATGSVL